MSESNSRPTISVKRMSTLFRKKDKEGPTSPSATSATASSSAAQTQVVQDKDAKTEADALKTLDEFKTKTKKGLPFDWNTGSFAAVLDLVRNKGSIDDRKLFLEHALIFVSRMEEGPMAVTIRNKIIQLFYNDLTHPAATSISPKFAWRTADGSYNNIDMPEMGKAGTPYSRSVQSTQALPANKLPDPGLLFDTLLRREGFEKHPGGLSSLMFAFATLVIHSVFRTSHRDVNINETSSYVDLGPLYGNNDDDHNRVRARDGYGTLYPDCFAEDRLLLLPPAVCTLLVLFNRNHNYIAAKVLEINERGNWVDPKTLSLDDPKARAKLIQQDEEIFQTARHCNIGWFGTVVFSDYFSCILGLVREGSSWSLSPFDEIRMDDHTLFERGKGNVCSVEFNCLYRWHATTSREAEAQTEQVFNHLFPGKAVDDVTPMDFKMAAYKIQSTRPPTNEWTFGGLKRQEDGSFADGDLANILHNATEQPAGAFRARGTPSVMRLNEIMGIEQSRKWGVCSMNEFRKYLGLKTFSSFLEWNSDPEIARAAELLYGDINNLELYVGLQAEEAKPLVDGAGLCPGYTISRAILSDAIALTRGDRFFTHDFTPFNLTAWGFHDCQRDPGAFGFGSTLGRLFLRTLPHHFTENSIYTFFPLMTPDSMKVNLKKMNLLDQYDLSRPKVRSPHAIIDDQEAVVAILKDTSAFSSPYGEKVARIIKGKGFYPTGDKNEQKIVTDALSGSPALVEKIGEFFYSATKKLVDQNSFTFVGGKTKGIDIVRDVFRVAPILWLANLTGIELKTSKDGEGDYTPQEFFEVLSDIYAFVFLNVDRSKIMVLQEKIKKNMPKLMDRITDNLGLFSGTKATVNGLMSTLFKHKKPDHHEIIQRLTENAAYKDRYVLSNTLLTIMVVANAELSLSLTNAVDLLLDKTKELQPLAASKDVSKLRGYVYEALRLSPPFAGVYRVSSSDQSVAGYNFKKGERVFLDVFQANQKKGPDVAHPAKDLLRAEGAFDYLGESLTVEIMAQVLRAVFEKDGIVRAPGHSGALQKFKDDSRPECHYAYLNHGHSICEWPTSLSVLYSA
ncbi:hypothetical protein EST38_g7146 [Candolleomyces aberdarensis]|uniref:Heme peroxidase n=1 Tax=Candolleomyces aberdarensis TaxID=2316362 RepID=A0A4Q2DI08_9AGAR|nr:hypothetical protein EST38_g7146 [Candolleomyces aberdarensis]